MPVGWITHHGTAPGHTKSRHLSLFLCLSLIESIWLYQGEETRAEGNGSADRGRPRHWTRSRWDDRETAATTTISMSSPALPAASFHVWIVRAAFEWPPANYCLPLGGLVSNSRTVWGQPNHQQNYQPVSIFEKLLSSLFSREEGKSSTGLFGGGAVTVVCLEITV